jgi:hypothetical protein
MNTLGTRGNRQGADARVSQQETWELRRLLNEINTRLDNLDAFSAALVASEAVVTDTVGKLASLAGLNTTIGYNKSGGGTGSLVFTKGILTRVT